ncbi:ABC-type multidrug/protein/lipid transport system, ATPase component (plasmid) [[Synechococcus] sp. NIES-970]|nr:ABC-type multidrug/protein/lipid transport system, ATPase component [[Synechococcus] sp. NIES-970]
MANSARGHWQQSLKSFVKTHVQNPAYRVVLGTINYNRGLIALNFNANLLSAVFEGSSFGLIFLALQAIASPDATAQVFNNSFLANTGFSAFVAQLSQGQLFVGLIVLAITLQYLRNALEYAGAVSSDYLSARIQALMTEKIFRQVMSFSFACASRYKVGDLTSYITLAAPTVNREIFYWNRLFLNVMTAIAQLVVLLVISPLLFLVTLLVSAGLFWFQKFLLPRIRQTALSVTQFQVGVSKHITESIQGLRVLHTFASQGRSIQTLQALQRDLVPQLEKQSRLIQLATPLGRSLTLTSIGLILLAGYSILQSRSTELLPVLVTFLAVLNRLTLYLNSITACLGVLAQNAGDFQRLEEILQTEDKEFIQSGTVIFKTLKDRIEFRGVSLKYPQTERWALRDVSFALPRGKVVALVGESGAGKSSIADLLIGLYQATQGNIYVDGTSLEEYDLQSWRSQLGVVSQDTFVFNDSILENIRYGKPNATDEEVTQAAIAAQADQFICDLPEAYQTVVGERGYRLSGGQRQRLALARAILKQPQVLILDEATSALDSKSEQLVQEALGQFQESCSILVIAHRLSTITDADEILVLEQGAIVQQGNHHNLLSQPGKYKDYWLRQSTATSS